MRSLRIINSNSLNNLQTFLQVYSLAEQPTTKVVETKSKFKERLHFMKKAVSEYSRDL